MSRYQGKEEMCLYLGVKNNAYEQLVATPYHSTLVKILIRILKHL